jgi:hypothetical protein
MLSAVLVARLSSTSLATCKTLQLCMLHGQHPLHRNSGLTSRKLIVFDIQQIASCHNLAAASLKRQFAPANETVITRVCTSLVARRISMRLLSAAVGILCLSTLAAAYTLPGQDDRAVRSDIQYIRCGGTQVGIVVEPEAAPCVDDALRLSRGTHRCGVCEALAKNAHRQVKALRDDLKPGKKVSLASQLCRTCQLRSTMNHRHWLSAHAE